MTITRPTGEQLRFVSAKTGEHVLDTYLEAAEVGDRELGDLLGDIFDENGNFVPHTHRGDYANGAVYVKGDFVRNPASTALSSRPAYYFCTAGHTAGASMDTTKFALVVMDGAAGSQYPPSNDNPQPPGAASAGVALSVSRSDHVHGHEPDASEATKGIAEVATDAEVATGADDGRIVSPLKLATRLASVVALRRDDTIRTGNFNAVSGYIYRVDTSGGPVTATLDAAPADNAYVAFQDVAGTFGTNNLIVERNGKNIDGSAADYTCDVSGVGLTLNHRGSTNDWRLVI